MVDKMAFWGTSWCEDKNGSFGELVSNPIVQETPKAQILQGSTEAFRAVTRFRVRPSTRLLDGISYLSIVVTRAASPSQLWSYICFSRMTEEKWRKEQDVKKNIPIFANETESKNILTDATLNKKKEPTNDTRKTDISINFTILHRANSWFPLL